jgi:hypothetical protein
MMMLNLGGSGNRSLDAIETTYLNCPSLLVSS